MSFLKYQVNHLYNAFKRTSPINDHCVVVSQTVSNAGGYLCGLELKYLTKSKPPLQSSIQAWSASSSEEYDDNIIGLGDENFAFYCFQSFQNKRLMTKNHLHFSSRLNPIDANSFLYFKSQNSILEFLDSCGNVMWKGTGACSSYSAFRLNKVDGYLHINHAPDFIDYIVSANFVKEISPFALQKVSANINQIPISPIHFVPPLYFSTPIIGDPENWIEYQMHVDVACEEKPLQKLTCDVMIYSKSVGCYLHEVGEVFEYSSDDKRKTISFRGEDYLIEKIDLDFSTPRVYLRKS